MCLNITLRNLVFVACLPQRWYNLHDPTPSMVLQLLQIEALALQCRGEWRSHIHLLLLPAQF